MTGFLADWRLAVRRLRNAPGFALAAVTILALGIGANLSAFSALNVAMLTSPPFPEADRLVSVDLTRSSPDGTWITRWPYPHLRRLTDWPDRLIDPVAGYREYGVTLTGLGPATDLEVEVVSPGYFDVVGRRLARGRGFLGEEADPSGSYEVTVVSHSFWQTRLGRDPDVLGRVLELNGVKFQIVGVAPPEFSGFTGRAALWLPIGAYAALQPGVLGEAGNHLAWVVGRLRPGTTLAAAEAQMALVGRAIAEEWPGDDTYGIAVRSFAEAWTNPAAVAASSFLGLAALLVLLAACANLAGLLFIRALRIVRAGAIRSALGASTMRLIRPFLLESVTLAVIGGLGGLGLSVWGIRLLAVAWPTQFIAGRGSGLRVIDPSALSIDLPVIICAVLLALGAALLIGLLPSLRISSARITDHLREGAGRTRRRGVAGFDPQAVFVGAQVALALVLLVGVGLMGMTVVRLMGFVDEGFRSERLLTFELSSPQAIPRFDPRDETIWRSHTALSAQFDDQLQQRLSALPDVEGVALSSGGILKHLEIVLGVQVESGDTRMVDAGSAGVVPVSDNYFDLLGMSVVSGRGFVRSDGMGSPPVVVLSEAAARRYFPDQDPIGRRVRTLFSLPGRETAEVVGVVNDVIYAGAGWPIVYSSLRERSGPRYATVRTRGDPSDALRPIRDELHAMDPTVAMRNVATMDQLIADAVGDRALLLWLLAIFATITVLLAVVGTWGMAAYAVAGRQRELGLRMALGARDGQVLRLILRSSVRTALIGVAVGLFGAWAGSRVLEAFLWNSSPRDPGILLGGAALLFVAVVGASYLPARRALRVDPAETLRTGESH